MMIQLWLLVTCLPTNPHQLLSSECSGDGLASPISSLWLLFSRLRFSPLSMASTSSQSPVDDPHIRAASLASFSPASDSSSPSSPLPQQQHAVWLINPSLGTTLP